MYYVVMFISTVGTVGTEGCCGTLWVGYVLAMEVLGANKCCQVYTALSWH